MKKLLASSLLGLVIGLGVTQPAMAVTRACRTEIQSAVNASKVPWWLKDYVAYMTEVTIDENWSRQRVERVVFSRLRDATGNEDWSRQLTRDYMRLWDSSTCRRGRLKS
jgi:hypothetical protein